MVQSQIIYLELIHFYLLMKFVINKEFRNFQLKNQLLNSGYQKKYVGNFYLKAQKQLFYIDKLIKIVLISKQKNFAFLIFQ